MEFFTKAVRYNIQFLDGAQESNDVELPCTQMGCDPTEAIIGRIYLSALWRWLLVAFDHARLR